MSWTAAEAFVEEHEDLSREQFLRRIRWPYLLGPGSIGGGTGLGAQAFSTSVLPPSNVKLGVRGMVLAPICKRGASNVFGMMITLGRTTNNDLVVRHANVSKFHAFFRRLSGEWLVNDGGSTNGTRVDGERVPQGRILPLRSGALIELAEEVTLEFYTPGDLYRWVQQSRGHVLRPPGGTEAPHPSASVRTGKEPHPATAGGGCRKTRSRRRLSESDLITQPASERRPAR